MGEFSISDRDIAQRRMGEMDLVIGDRIRLARHLEGMTLTELARHMGVTHQQVQKYEMGANRIAASSLFLAATALKRPVGWFFGPDKGGTKEFVFDQYPEALAGFSQIMAGGKECDRLLLESLIARLSGDTSEEVPARGVALNGDAQGTSSRKDRLECRTVLMVDDDPDVLTVLSKHVEKAGRDVITAYNGETALQIVQSPQELCAIVTDFAMPGMNGVELLAKVTLIRPDLPSIIISGFTDSIFLDEITPRIEVLRKPFKPADLITKLDWLIRQSEERSGR
ncbi:response regulator [Roseomonas sp. GCM10028921]